MVRVVGPRPAAAAAGTARAAIGATHSTMTTAHARLRRTLVIDDLIGFL
jgi:hypothetical protein